MSLAPFLNASLAIQLHGLGAVCAFMLGIVQFVAAKGTGRISLHQRVMQGVYVGGLIVAGGFAFVPPRVFGRMIFGG